ncbi:unnamed protein product [Rhizoctonia solani]|uniref:Threonine/serine exporter-like N-terminal domain-containing protein n=1 Tax=Rhizoctonia solani TaxID=456999 RepID=A0A8H3GRB8_9AGAM|nr:unnamed protein product [Rhizoctonia solani]
MPDSPTSPHRPVPEAIGAEPGDRYTQLLHRTRSRSTSRPRRVSVTERGLGSRRDTMSANPLHENTMPGITEVHHLSGRPGERSLPVMSDAPTPTGQPIHVSVLSFGSSHKRPSIATTNTNISTPPPMYTGYGPCRAPATEPIVQRAQFDDPLRTQELDQEQPRNPFGAPSSGLRHRNAYSAYYNSPIVPPEPVMGAGMSPGFFDMYGYPPGRTNMIQPHGQSEDWENEEEEKHRLANYHAQVGWDPDDEYDDPEPSVAARRPYDDATLSGYRPPSCLKYPYSPKSDWDTSSQTMITVGSETGRKHFITENICPMEQRRSFILVLAKALLQFQAPSHRIENQLEAAARVLDVPAEFLHLPSLVIASFGSFGGEQGAPAADKPRKFSFSSNSLKSAITMAVLGKNKKDTRNEDDQDNEGDVPESKPKPAQEESTRRTTFGLGVASKNPLYSNIFEISAAMMMSFIARGLSSINGNLFCYSAISSASVVLILPGSIVLSSSLELASRSIISGSVKMVYAIVYSLFLGFSLTIGSDFYYLVDQSARPRIAAGMANLTDSYDLPGIFTGDNGQTVFSGAFTFLKPAASVTNTVKYVSKGCTRRVDGPWYLRQLPIWTLLVLVPLYSVISSMWKLQPFLSKQLPIMVFISCCSYAANKAANRYIFNRSDVVSAIGAFVTGILGNAYARIFRGTAYTAMVTAVGFLVPLQLDAPSDFSELE